MESREIIDINIETEKEEKYMMEINKKISYDDLKRKIKEEIIKHFDFDIQYKDKIYTSKDKQKIFNFEQGDIIIIILTISKESFEINADFHKNINLNEADKTITEISGLLQLFLFRYITRNIENQNNIEKIKNKEIKNIILELKEGINLINFSNDSKKNIKAQLEETKGNNILSYSNYISSLKIKKKEIENLINELFGENKKKDILDFWSILSKYQTFNALFERDFNKAIEKSYFDFSLISLSLYQHKRRKQFIEALNECSNTVVRYLFHGTRIDPISKIVTDDFAYAKRPLFGMGVYFTDLLDYASYYAGGTNLEDRRSNFGRINSVGEFISCIATEVFYDIEKKKNIYNEDLVLKEVELNHFPTYDEIKRDYKKYMVEENGVHYVRVEASNGSVKNEEKIEADRKLGKFMGIEYVITEMNQMLPLYGLTLKRNEYFVIWRDPVFTIENDYSEYLRERRRFIFKQAKMNSFFDSSAERLLEIIKRKKYNKIILLSNCGVDLSGKKFVEVARKILGFDVPVLFFSGNRDHFKWIQEFPNAFYTNDPTFYEKYINNYNKEGLLKLKKEIEDNYNIKLKINDDFLSFPKFVQNKQYSDLIFEDICPYFRKVIIKNRANKKILFMENGNPIFKLSEIIETEKYFWYIILINNEITLFSNESYLYFDKKSETAKFKAMEKFKYEKIDKYYLIYFENKNNVLTIKENNIVFEKEKNNNQDQLFDFIDDYYKY